LPARTDLREIAGYYTLAAYSVSPGDLPPEVARKLPRYPQIPAAILGRLAVSEKHKRQGLGEFLLLDAMQRSLDQSKALGLFALFVERASRKLLQALRFHTATEPATAPLLANEDHRGPICVARQ